MCRRGSTVLWLLAPMRQPSRNSTKLAVMTRRLMIDTMGTTTLSHIVCGEVAVTIVI